jgi:hypothetical protein
MVEKETKLHDGEGWREFYGTLETTSPPRLNPRDLIEQFIRAVVSAHGNGQVFGQIPFIAAFLRMARGFDDGLPTHYPRARQEGQVGPVPPHPEGQAYEWFVANDQVQHGQVVAGYALPELANDQGLPMLDAP